MSHQYTIIKVLSSTGSKSIKNEPLDEAARFLEAQGIEVGEPNAETDQLLFKKAKEINDIQSLQCLRCRVSYPIFSWIDNECKLWEKEYKYDFWELIVEVLNDEGKRQRFLGNSKREFKYSELASIEQTIFNPFSAEVIRTFDPLSNNQTITGWTRTKLKCHNKIKEYAKNHGRLVHSDMGLIKASSSKQIKESLSYYFAGKNSVESLILLHKRYCHFYVERERFKWFDNKVTPTKEFCEVINPTYSHFETIEQLQCLVNARRRFAAYLHNQGKDALPDENKSDLSDEASSHQKSLAPEQFKLLKSTAEKEMRKHMSTVLSDVLISSKAHEKCVWMHYGEGFSQRDIAEKCELSPGQVSKTLKLKAHKTDIAIAVAQRLKRQPIFRRIANREETEKFIRQIKDYLECPADEEFEKSKDKSFEPLRLCVKELLEGV